jgi:hypothetical protein
MAKNDFLQRRDERDQKFFDVGREVGFQQCMDYVFNALREPEFVGEKNVWGEKRLVGLYNLCASYEKKFHSAWDARNKEAELLQKELDARLKEGLPNHYAPFKERYPYLKDFKYDKPRKGWID